MPLGDRKNMVYAGTAATYGRGRALIVATGMHLSPDHGMTVRAIEADGFRVLQRHVEEHALDELERAIALWSARG